MQMHANIVADVIDCIRNVLSELVDGKFHESSFLDHEVYGKFAVSIDEMMPQGVLETLDPESIAKLTKLKS